MRLARRDEGISKLTVTFRNAEPTAFQTRSRGVQYRSMY
jgi:hypothetical protein